MTSAGITGFCAHGFSLSAGGVLVYLNDGVGSKEVCMDTGRPLKIKTHKWHMVTLASFYQSKQIKGQPESHRKGHRLQFLKELQSCVTSSADTETKWSHFCILLTTVDFFLSNCKNQSKAKRLHQVPPETEHIVIAIGPSSGRNLKS